ncbi:MAG: DUF2282 domain-containing protein [Pseudomonadota bacterium]|nr:DUF2282 domain-containing protein [Pseudomonadota bacterium]
MNQKLIVSSAFASLLAFGITTHAATDPKGKDKCYGIAKAGQNDCAQAGAHDCAGLSKANMAAGDFKYVAAGTCKEMKGMTEAESKAKKS